MPLSLIPLHDTYEPVTDPDEEIFVLYSELQSSSQSHDPLTTPFRGLGFIDNHKDVLDITFELQDGRANPPQQKRKARKAGSSARPPLSPRASDKTVEIEIKLHQDKTALRTRKGDTGSVVWKASVDFARLVLQQYYAGPSTSISTPTPPLFDRDLLPSQTVLELGAGTGLLAVALSRLVKHYTATDIAPLVPLIKKNVALNFPGSSSDPGSPLGSPSNTPKSNTNTSKSNTPSISVQELDWLSIHSASSSSPSSPPTSSKTLKKIYDPTTHPIDLLLLVDCLYHPSLIPPCLATIDYLTTPGHTSVLVVSELRAEDVLREFLEKWLGGNAAGSASASASESPRSRWEVWRIPNTDMGRNYVIWVGRKRVTDAGVVGAADKSV